MAVLGKIRALGPEALISVIGLALFAFVFFDILFSFSLVYGRTTCT